MRNLRAAVVPAVYLLISAFAFGQKVNVERDKAADFSQYKTYAWVPGRDAQRPGVHLTIVSAIEHAFDQRGVTKIDDLNKADLLIRYSAIPDVGFNLGAGDPTNSGSGGIPLQGGTPWTSGVGPLPSSASRKGTLLLEMFDRAKHREVWRSTASGTLKSNKDTLDKIDAGIQKMFAGYPK
jgi:Domain of unknown function (DUF4136)